jgi:SAM-dependent methyltransferase
MSQAPNPEQTEFWNAAPGENWVRHLADLDAIHRGVSETLQSLAAPATGERVLDIGCGAGTTTFDLARAVHPGEVLGIDISAPLLRRAAERRRELQLANAHFLLADAQAHPFPARHYDLVVSRFGVMFFSDPVAAFRNIATALRPGGRIALACWAGPEHNPWFTLPQRIAVARMGPVAPTPPDAPGPMAFRDIPRVCAILRDAGFTAVKGEQVTNDLHHPGGPEALVRLASHVGPIARILRETNATEDDEAAIRNGLRDALQPFASTDGIRIPAGINLFSATRP